MLPILFLLLPVAFFCGWFIALFAFESKPPRFIRKIQQNYFEGLYYLINDESDKALDLFIKLVNVDGETLEMHLALASLYRKKGEFEKAIRIHQNLIARPNLHKRYKIKVLSELGQDFLKAGLLDRAERLFIELVEQKEEVISSIKFLLMIYEQEKDWEKAIYYANVLKNMGKSMDLVLSQYHCEFAEQLCKKGNVIDAKQNLKKAQKIDPDCLRASLIYAEIEFQEGFYEKALRWYQKILHEDKIYLPLIMEHLFICFQKMHKESELITYLETFLHEPTSFLIVTLSDFFQKHNIEKALNFLTPYLQKKTSVLALKKFLELSMKNQKDLSHYLTILFESMNLMLHDQCAFQCVSCGFLLNTLEWLCPSCKCWCTIKSQDRFLEVV